MRLLALPLLLLTLALPALAVDGVVEINQTCAVQSGCFSGDTAGYPITIDGSAGRSYRLSGDLVVPDATTDGLLISSDDISIDLNQFRIIGAGCVGAKTSACRPATGSGGGVRVNPFPEKSVGISVRNGSIIGMGYGVALWDQSEVTHLRVRWNRLAGIHGDTGTRATQNTAVENGGTGIRAGKGSVVSGNVANENGTYGIEVQGSSTVTGNTARGNSDIGILVFGTSTVSKNTIDGNGGQGIFASNGCTISENTVRLSGKDGILVGAGSTVVGNTVYDNTGDGIETGEDCLVQRNTARINTGYGLNLGQWSIYRENVVNENTAGTINGWLTAFNTGANSCDASLSCP